MSLLALTFVSDSVKSLELVKFQELVQSQPFWLQALEVVFLCDIGIYWGHRLSHRYNFLWRFHRVHHTSEKLDWIAAYREHPFDNIYTRTIESLPAFLMGFPLELIAGFILLRGLWGLVIHSNSDFDLGLFKYILGSPRLHHWHHEINHSGKCNFANLMPLMDLLFGTYYDPAEKPEEYGVPEKLSHNYIIQIISPLVPNFFKNKSN
ncbi:MAG: sterol desaturase family protein [Lentisphaeraceae bacterium]|nr:sterol desaturase family protein [Lentisphaeraceae bacterium]